MSHSPVAHRGLALGQPAHERQHQRQRQVGGGLGEHVGRVAHRDAARGGRLHVDVVHAHGVVGDRAQVRATAAISSASTGSVSRSAGPRRQPPGAPARRPAAGRSGQTSTSCSARSRSSAAPGRSRVTKHARHQAARSSSTARAASSPGAPVTAPPGMGARAGQVEAPRCRRSRAGPAAPPAAGPGSISPWKMWPPVMPKRSSSCARARAPGGRRSGRAAPGTPRRSGRWRSRRPPRRPRPAGSTGRTCDSTCLPARRQRVVGGGLAGRLDPRPRGRAARARASSAAALRSSSVKPMSIAPAPRLLAGPGREVGQPVQQHHHLHHRARPGASPSGAARPRPGAAVRTGSAFESTRPRAHLLPALEHHARGARRPPPAPARPAPRAAPARPPPRPRSAARPSPRPCRRARSPTRPAPRPPGRGRGRSRRTPCPGRRGRPACRSAPGSRTARAPPRRGCPRSSAATEPVEDPRPDRLQPALAVGRLGQQRPGPRGRRAPSARRTPRSRRRRRATSRARAARACARALDHVTTLRPSGNGANR